MGPSLFGYDPLQIPYHPGSGPFISPLILAVICAIASERDPKYPPDLRVKLYHEALELISSSPTGSFMNTVDLETVRLQPEEWDPELGIGPEEVVAVSYLALFIDDRVRGPNIARLSRRWVEGLINVSDIRYKRRIQKLSGKRSGLDPRTSARLCLNQWGFYHLPVPSHKTTSIGFGSYPLYVSLQSSQD